MQYVTLSNGIDMPILGFGVYQIDDLDVCERCVADAIDVGYRLIDTAAAYKNETAVGKAIKKSGVAREDLFVTTKIWIQDYGQETTVAAFERCLDRLGLDYLDLCLLHQPFGDYYGAWRALEVMLKEGRARAIGVSNFYPDRFIDLACHCEIVPQVNQMEVNPFCQRHQDFAILKERGVQLESWGPFAEGRNNLFTNEVLSSIGQSHGRSVAQVVLRWLVQRGVVAIPKSVHRERMEENFKVFDFSLTEAEMEAITALDTGKSTFFSHYDPELVNWLANVRFEGI